MNLYTSAISHLLKKPDDIFYGGSYSIQAISIVKFFVDASRIPNTCWLERVTLKNNDDLYFEFKNSYRNWLIVVPLSVLDSNDSVLDYKIFLLEQEINNDETEYVNLEEKLSELEQGLQGMYKSLNKLKDEKRLQTSQKL